MKARALHTSDGRQAEKTWLRLGGRILPIRRTGEKFFVHDHFDSPLRLNGRRTDVQAKLLSRINQLLRLKAMDGGALSNLASISKL